MKVTLKILLALAIIALAYLCYTSITTPINFNSEVDKRNAAIEARLVQIRNIQIEYKNAYKTNAANFDELQKFLETHKLPFIVKEGVLTDDQLQAGLTEKEAVRQGIIKRDTVWTLAKDTLLPKGFDLANLRYVPGVPGEKIAFEMDTATLKSGSGYDIKVFQCQVPYEKYLGDLNKQLVQTLIEKATKSNKYPGLRVGSIEEINNNAGNWE
jgi:hypothetical protein